jgi:nitrite reductase (NO-forming)
MPPRLRPSELLVAFFTLAVAWLAAAAVAAAVLAAGGPAEAGWLALHLAFVGGVSQLVLGAAQFFVCAFLATDPPPRRLVRAQLASWNAGALAIAAGVPVDGTALTGLGGGLLLGGLVLFAAGLRGMERRSLQRARWAVRWYYAAAGFLGVGALLGPLLAAGVAWTHGSLLAAHLVLNLGGWFGTAIVGTLHTFHPSLTGTQLRWPGLQGPTFRAWTAGIALLAVGCAFDAVAAALAGWVALAGAVALLGSNLAAGERAATQRTSPGLLVAAAQPLLLLAVVAGFTITLADGPLAALLGPDREAIALMLVAGWIGLTVTGSLLHLLRLLARVRRLDRPAPPPPRVAALGLVVVALVPVAAAARLIGADAVATPVLAALAAVYAALGARAVALAWRALRAAPLQI